MLIRTLCTPSLYYATSYNLRWALQVEFQKDHFFFLLYDPPTKLTDRHNEVVWDAPYDTSAVELSGLEDATL